MTRILIAFMLLASAASAQKIDSAVIHRHLDGELTTASTKTAEGRYYRHMPVKMAAGDMVYIVQKSMDFVALFGVQDSTGKVIGVVEDKETFYKTIGSTAHSIFRAKRKGTYLVAFSSKGDATTGKFSVDIYYYTRAKDKVRDNPNATFCEKFNAIADNKFLGFEFLKQNRIPAFDGLAFTPLITLIDGATNKVTTSSGFSYYEIEYPVFTDLAAANAKFDELESATTKCAVGYTKYVRTLDKINADEKKDFVRTVTFLNMGKMYFSVNKFESNTKVKNTVTLKLSKRAEGYLLTYVLE